MTHPELVESYWEAVDKNSNMLADLYVNFHQFDRGATRDSDVNALRARQERAFLATLLLSAGVPLLLGATSSAALSGATTTPIARTMKSRDSTGWRSTRTCVGSRRT
jgi:hypothetical protein